MDRPTKIESVPGTFASYVESPLFVPEPANWSMQNGVVARSIVPEAFRRAANGMVDGPHDAYVVAYLRVTSEPWTVALERGVAPLSFKMCEIARRNDVHNHYDWQPENFATAARFLLVKTFLTTAWIENELDDNEYGDDSIRSYVYLVREERDDIDFRHNGEKCQLKNNAIAANYHGDNQLVTYPVFEEFVHSEEITIEWW